MYYEECARNMGHVTNSENEADSDCIDTNSDYIPDSDSDMESIETDDEDQGNGKVKLNDSYVIIYVLQTMLAETAVCRFSRMCCRDNASRDSGLPILRQKVDNC